MSHQDPQQPQGYQPPTHPQPPVPYGGVPQQQPYGQPYPQQVVAKNPGLCLLASFFFPGLGSLMAGRALWGIAIFVCYVVSWFLTVVLIGLPLLVGCWVWGLVDAYLGAQAWNRRHGILS